MHLGGIALASSASDSAYSYTFFHSVVRLLSVCLTHSCTLLKPFHGFRCHLAGTLVGSNDTLWQRGSLTQREICGSNPHLHGTLLPF